MIIVILNTAEVQPGIDPKEAVLLLAEYDQLSDDSPSSHKAAVAVTRALESLAQSSGVPMWWLAERFCYAGDETPEELLREWEEWQEWRKTVPELPDREELEGNGVPF